MKLPVKFLDRMQSLLGDEFDAFQKAIELPVPVSVRINPKKNTTPYEGSSNIPWCDKAYFLKESHRRKYNLFCASSGFGHI